MSRVLLPFVIVVLVCSVAALAATPLSAQGQVPASCTGPNPYFVTSCYAQGKESDDAAIVAFRDTPDDSGHIMLAKQSEVGATYGIGYRTSENALYVAAYHKRGTAFGPGGPGMIYRVDVANGGASEWLNVPNAGTDRHDESDDYWPDTTARNFAGVLGLGDLDLNTDGTELYVMNLSDRKIYRYRVDDKAALGTIDIGSVNETWASQGRPFGLAFHNGKLYHAVVSSAYSSQDAADLSAYVYETDPDGANVRLVNQFSLDFARGNVVPNIPARWLPWKDGFNAIGGGQLGAYPQPMITDIEFADNNDMILGFRDRNGDMTFFDPGGRNPPGEGTGIPAGDILISRYNGTTWDTTPDPEFYEEDFGPSRGVHDETGFGGLARVLDENVVVTLGLAPLQISSGGAFWFNNDTGDNPTREEIYRFDSTVNFGKANGLGDLELFCVPEQATATPTETGTASPTVPVTSSSTSTTTPTATFTPPVTTSPVPTLVTSIPTQTTTAVPTVTPVVTRPAGSTDVPEERRDSTPPPGATAELPKLPATGGGGGSGDPLVLLCVLIALGALALARSAAVARHRV